jgi:hypothetical protein
MFLAKNSHIIEKLELLSKATSYSISSSFAASHIELMCCACKTIKT